jgi:hypothetical protein
MRRFLVALSALLALAAGCTKQQTQSYYDKQQDLIDKFVTAANGVRTVYKGNAVRVVMKEGTTADSLAANGVISFYYGGYTLPSGTSVSASNLFATNYKTLAESARWSTADEESFAIKTLKLDEVPLLEGLRDGLNGVKGGEESYILFTGKYGFGNKASGTIPAKATLVYHIWVESISNE